MNNKADHKKRQQIRLAAIVIAATGLIWVIATWAGVQYGWANRTRALFDLMALAGFAFALVMVFRLWRARRQDEER